MDVNTQEPASEGQKEELTFEELLALLCQRMDERLEDPTLTPDQRYRVVSRLIGLLE